MRMKVGRGCHLVVVKPVGHLSNRVEDAYSQGRAAFKTPKKDYLPPNNPATHGAV